LFPWALGARSVAGAMPLPRRARSSERCTTISAANHWQAVFMQNLDQEQFESLVVGELDALADEIVEGLDNVVFVTEDRPEDGSLDVLGLYDGVALTERGQYGFGELPDRIILFREPLLAICKSLNELKEQIHITLVHEIAHYYGIDDQQLHELGWA